MGRRKDNNTPEENVKIDKSESPQKSKHHRHRRHRKRKVDDLDSDTSIDVSFEDSINTKPAFKIKMKINKEQHPISASESIKSHSRSQDKKSSALVMATSPKSSNKKKKGNKGRESGTSSEEERWLDAIESGKLEEVDEELKKIKPKDPKMMTARQRAMYERGNDKEPSPGGEVLLALPSGYKEKVMTAEAIQKAALKSQKRKQLADEKREKDKKKTMERLLKKQETKTIKGNAKGKPLKKHVPLISYRNTVESITVSMPPDVDFPLEAKTSIDPPKPVICGVANCANLKKYLCSRTGIPLCSLQCYKNNIVNVVVS
ncbi:INO80 complex subunit B [Arctopsyche grandis]|uniref:INO80 complex subunit B n=1 Tax=Arctopsyche grandis TaxID=121162 RepID=UPI00406D9AB8